MAVATKVVRVANPRRGKYRLKTARSRNAKRRRKLSPKQIRIFGTPAQKAALKRKYRAKRTVKAKANPKRKRSNRRRSNSRPKVKVVRRARPRRKVRRKRSNPGLVVTLGSVNPKRRSTKVARRRKKRNTTVRRKRRSTVKAVRHHRRRRRTTNRRRVVVVNPVGRRRRRRHVNARRRHVRRHRNPTLFGRSSPKDLLTMVGGGLVGVTVTKMIPRYIPSSITGAMGSSPFMTVLVSGVSAWLAGFLAGKMNREFGEAVLFGGLMQTGSLALNAFLPSVGGQFSLGYLMDGNYVVPQNPLGGQTAGLAAVMARGQAAYGPAY